MSRPKMPASLKKGNTETKKQKKERANIEAVLKGNDDKVFEIPEYLDDLAKIYYKFLLEELGSANILSNLDTPLLEQTADCLSKIRQCDDMINTQGLFYMEEDRYGHERLVENVAVKTKLNLLTKYGQFANSLGLSPSARASLASKKIEEKEKQDDPLLQILRGNVK